MKIVARRLVEPGAPALAEIVEAFGAGVLDGRGRLDRARMRERIFGCEADRRALESILHPKVRREMRDFAASADAPYVLFVIPLLVETGQAPDMDRVIVVDAPRTLRTARAAARDGSSPATIEAILASQATREDRLAVAGVLYADGAQAVHAAAEADIEAAIAFAEDSPLPDPGSLLVDVYTPAA